MNPGLRPDRQVCVRDSHYASTVDGRGILTHDPRVHDPDDGRDCVLFVGDPLRCPQCGYTERDKAELMDHAICERRHSGAAMRYEDRR